MRELIFATGPQGLGDRGGELRRKMGMALSHLLEGVRVELFACTSYGELLDAVLAANVAMAWMPPGVFAQASELTELELLGRSVRHGKHAFRGALFVRASSPMKRVEDLAGKSVALVDPHSCAGNLYPRKILLDRGLDPDVFLGEQRFVGSHRAVARAVHEARADVGATYVHLASDGNVLSAGFAEVADPEDFFVIAASEEIPADAIVATRSLPVELRPSISRALRALGDHDEARAPLAGLFQCVAFEPADPSDYDGVRAIRNATRLL